jgi:ferric-dicitrate binding protein FerR (iron transport regulator)
VKPKAKYSGLKAVDEQSKRFFTGGKFHWEKSGAQVWNNIEIRIDHSPGRTIWLNLAVVRWAAAAVFIVLLGISGFIRFSTKTIQTLAGEHRCLTLPDGSTVELNAQSTVSYHPYWWSFDRKLAFEGEALFNVEKGKRFRVISGVAITEVLGTRFNIFAREKTYNVTCIEGSVKVVSRIGEQAILKASYKASVQPGGKIILHKDIDVLPEISWKDYTFFFTAVPLSNVFAEIERQYGVKINVEVDVNSLYTGNFSKNQNVEDVLGYICPAMGFKFIRQSKTAYSVISDSK